ncbi:MAG: Fe(2+) transporter permease subunit FeoB [Gammaproteobacteria bacterium]|nr:MAG: Fe(2+) transporter permease subunit FeoB [Gammaproteobacteria bacterium]
MSDYRTVALVGNPNCGKTTLFNALTGARQKVGNWPGVTVERKQGHFNHAGRKVQVVDLPGIYSLHVSRDDDSVDYQIAQDYILSGQPDLLVNIIDAASIERGLYLTTQLLDAGIPMLVALNMIDVADQQGMHIDPVVLSEALGCPVVPIVASRGEGLGALKDVLECLIIEPVPHPARVVFPDDIEQASRGISLLLEQQGVACSRLLAMGVLEGDRQVLSRFPPDLQEQLQAQAQAIQHEQTTTDRVIAARYQWVDGITWRAIKRDARSGHRLTEMMDKVLLNRWLAFPIFLLVNYLMFLFTIHIGSAFIDVFDIVAGAVFVELPRHGLMAMQAPDWLVTLLADGLGGGIQLVATFIPVIACLFLFLAILEDSGYMARAAFLVDRLLRSVGLPGKSFVPLIVGFGCNVPSVLAARTLSSQQDRILTTLMAPYMSCGARLTVYTLFATAFFPVGGQNVIFALYLTGIILAVLTGFMVRRFVFTAEQSPFILELPPYHMPTVRSILIHTWQRLQGFVMRAGKAIVLVVVALSFINSIGTDGSFGNENTEKSALSEVGRVLTPVFEPMGVKPDNWPATVGIFSGIFAKEVVVGTLDALYGDMARLENGDVEEAAFDFWATVAEGFATVPANLSGITDALLDPLGIGVGDLSDLQAAAEAQEVTVDTLVMMTRLFDGELAAFAYLLFILLYFPCVATVGAIYKEAGPGWAYFSCAWSLVLGYSSAVIVYQAGHLLVSPGSAAAWIGGMLVLALACYAALLRFARVQARKDNRIPMVNL